MIMYEKLSRISFFPEPNLFSISFKDACFASEIMNLLIEISDCVKKHYQASYYNRNYDNNFFNEKISYSEFIMNSISDNKLKEKIFKNIDIFNLIFEKMSKIDRHRTDFLSGYVQINLHEFEYCYFIQ